MDSTTPDPQPQPQPQPQQHQPQPVHPQPRPQQQQQQHQPHQPKPQQQQQLQQQQPQHPHQHQHQHQHPHTHTHQPHQAMPYSPRPPVQTHHAPYYYPHQTQIHPYAPQPYASYAYTAYPPPPPAWNPAQAANYNPGLVQPSQQTNVPQSHTKQAPPIINPAINADQSQQQTLQTVTITNQPPVGQNPPIREKRLAVLKHPETKVVVPLGAPTTTTPTNTTTTTDKNLSATTASATAVSTSPTIANAATATTLSATTSKEENKRVDNKRQDDTCPAKNVQTKQNAAQALLQKASEDDLEIKTPITKNNGQGLKKVDNTNTTTTNTNATTTSNVTNIETTTTKDKKVPSSTSLSSPKVESSIPQDKVKEKINGNSADNDESCKIAVKEVEPNVETFKKVSEVASDKSKTTLNNGQDSIVNKNAESNPAITNEEIAQDNNNKSSPQVEARISVQDGDQKDEGVNGNVEDGDDSNKQDEESDSKVELHYEPGQYNPISNRKGKRVYSKEFMLDVCEKICKLDLLHKQSDDKNGTMDNELHNALSEKYDPFAPPFQSSNQRYTPTNRQNEPARRQSQHNYAGRSSAGQDRQRKVITSASLTQEVELKTTSNPWRPTKDIKEDAPNDEVETETLKKKFRSILNKLTPNNFENLALAVTDLNIDTESKLGEVIDIVFAKALAEPGYCVLYGQMCSHLKKITAGQANFGNTLLKRCQHQFQSDIYSGLNLNERKEKIDNEENPEIKKQLNEELYEDMYRCRMKGLGLIKFIGELYKIEMLNDKIMFDCVLRLLSDTSEESIECLCDLLATIGEKLDRSSQKNAEKEKKAPRSVPKGNANQGGQKSMAAVVASGSTSSQQAQQKASLEQQSSLTTLDQVFDQLHKIRKNKDLPLSVRIRFKLLDTCELREKENWQSKKTKDNNPKKIEEIREAYKEKLEQERRQQSAMGPRRSQEGRRGLGHSGGSSNQISSLANESSGNRGQSNMHTSSSSHLLRDHSIGDNMKSNHNDIESHKEHQKKIEAWTKLSSTNRASSSAEPLRPNPGFFSLRPGLNRESGGLRPATSAATATSTPPPTSTAAAAVAVAAATTTTSTGPAPAASEKNEDQ